MINKDRVEYSKMVKDSFLDQVCLFKKCADTINVAVTDMGMAMADIIMSGHKLLIAGNGGSAADAQHMAAEISGRYLMNRKGLAAMALTVDTSVLTAVANDFGFDRIFSRQIEALANSGDGLILFSTSGNSPNLVKAFEQAQKMGLNVFLLLGKSGGELKKMEDLSLDNSNSKTNRIMSIVVDSNHTPRIQEVHLIIYHSLCHIIEELCCR